jgi:hypothetical protein
MRKVTKGNVTIKLWDLGGQPRFRSMWERYCRAVSAIVYVTNFLFSSGFKSLCVFACFFFPEEHRYMHTLIQYRCIFN